ncbi:MAG TPA: selenocysteine-specific translation elongation factor [Anaerolineae bacterium]|nr:selenocysteine-specific translation elongation factor [Anaerolineae bacterium]
MRQAFFIRVMRLVGTAGHVDHGKSTLVQALTGINPDRLKEEQTREMTIDLGFAWLTLPHGETISLVDVPGHEAFIKNMLAGAGGMDAVLLVIAADEGIMPQTREHLAILDLLQLQGGVVALTKTDLPLEPDWLVLVQDEIRTALHNTVLQDAEIIPVSAKTRQGLKELEFALERVLARVSEKSDRNRPRLPIDRVFTMSGFGTVVTGTLSDGRFTVSDDVEIAPRGVRSRIRGLQAHKEKIETALPGGRVAINLANVATEELERGAVVIHPGTYTPTTMLDARIQWLKSAPKPMMHNQELELFLYASEGIAHVRLLESDALAPGQSGWAQLLLQQPIVAAKGDRFILRYPSPSITVGGGIVVEPHPSARYRRRRADVIERLERAAQGTPADQVLQLIESHPAVSAREITEGSSLEETTTRTALDELENRGLVISLNGERMPLYITAGRWNRWRGEMRDELTAYHKQFPLRAGMPHEELKSRLNLPARAADAALSRAIEEHILRANAKTVALVEHRVTFDSALQQKVDALLEQFARAPYTPPSQVDAKMAIGEEALNALIEQGTLKRIAPNVLLMSDTVNEMQHWVMETIQKNGQVTAAELRDRFDTSRKYAIAFLEYLDSRRVTKRVGDARVLR